MILRKHVRLDLPGDPAKDEVWRQSKVASALAECPLIAALQQPKLVD